MPQRVSPSELAKQMPEMHRRATQAGMSVSAYLEKQDPSDHEDNKNSKLDAFGRVMREVEIIPTSNPAAGIWASKIEDFIDDEESRAVFLEWTQRTYRRAKYGKSPNTRAIITTDELLNTPLRPYADQAGVQLDRFRPELPLSALVAVDTPITGTAYRSVYMDDTMFDDVNYARVNELAEIPMAALRTASEETRLHKYGRGIEWSYESVREQRLDKVALFIAELALKTEEEKTAYVVDLLVNGDGNAGTAADVVDSTDLDSASTTDLTLAAYLLFKKQFRSPYRPNVFLGNAMSVTALEMLPIGTTNIPYVTLPPNSAIGNLQPLADNNYGANIGYATVDSLPDSTLLAIDSRFALERVSQIGSRITESDKFITRQSNVVVFTETEGWKILSKHANKLLEFND